MDLRSSIKLLFILAVCLLAYYYYYLKFYLSWSAIYPRKSIFHTSATYETFTHGSVLVPEIPLAQSVLVFLHIQKTGGSLIERSLVKTGLIGRECVCPNGRRRCLCKTVAGDTWLVSRFSTGWVCGLHADMTEYSECLESALNVIDERFTKRKYIFSTVLRDPVDRYLSEWLQVRRGSTWHSSRLRCAGQKVNTTFYRPCYTLPEFRSVHTTTDTVHSSRSRGHPDWSLVPLTTFLACPYNLAHNRQTRMLAELPRLGCYKHLTDWSANQVQSDWSSRSAQFDLRASAKHTLLSRIRVFGLSEHIIYSQYLYQRSMNVVFHNLLSGLRSAPLVTRDNTRAGVIRSTLNASDLQAIRDRNRLDINLYQFARRLFTRRLTVYLLGDLTLPRALRRPLFTLWAHQPSSWNALEYLLLEHGSPVSFKVRLERQLIRGFLRQGSRPLTEKKAELTRDKWADRLTMDFEAAGLLSSIMGSLQEDKKHDEEDDEEEEEV